MACCGALRMSCCPWGWAASLSSKDHTFHGFLETPLGAALQGFHSSVFIILILASCCS